MALFTPCPNTGGIGNVNTFVHRPGFGPHQLTINQQNSLILNNNNGGFSVILIPDNNTVAFDIGSALLIYVGSGAGVINITPNPGVIFIGAANINPLQIMRLDKLAIDSWTGTILATPVW